MEYYSSLNASQLDPDTPTVFEIISSLQLEALLSPAIRYILVHYATRFPSYLLRITNRFDEINLVLRSLIEWYFLNKRSSSFTENFYGLERVLLRVLSHPRYKNLLHVAPTILREKRRLSTIQKLISLIEITGTAYIAEKLDHAYEVWYSKLLTHQLDITGELSPRDTWRIRLKRIFLKIYPYFVALIRTGNFMCTIAYLGGSVRSPSLLTWLFGINYARSNQFVETLQATNAQARQHPPRTKPPSSLEYLLRLVTKNFAAPSYKVMKLILRLIFPAGLFALKFFEWWSTSGFAEKMRKNLGRSLDFILPPPLHYDMKKSTTTRSNAVCRLCKNEISNPAIIETGYVFDYPCIYEFLRNSHKISADSGETDFSEDESQSDSDREKKDDAKIKIPGGRCPVTGRKLLGCHWNESKQEWDVEGIRRVIL